MDDKPNQIDLHRREYRAEPIKGEPLFGPGWPFGVAALITIAVGVIFHDASAPVHVLGAIGGVLLVTIFYQFLG